MKKLRLMILAACLTLSTAAISGNTQNQKGISITNNTNDIIFLFLPRSGITFELYAHSTKQIYEPERRRYAEFELWDKYHHNFTGPGPAGNIICDKGNLVIDGTVDHYSYVIDSAPCN